MSNEAQDIVQDMDWDNIEDTAPSVDAADEAVSQEEAVSTDENGNEVIDHENEEVSDEIIEAKDEDSKDEPKADEKVEEKAEESGDKSDAIDISKLSDDQKIKVKVDGEEQEITLKEYKNGISGQKAIQKRFNEVDNERKSLQAEIDNINKYVADLGNTMKNVSMVEGLNKIAELNGIAPHQVEQALIKELLPRIQELQGMDEQQRELQYKQKELEYKEKQLESESNLSAQKQAQAELQSNISKAREAHAISDDEWNDAFKYLDKNLDPSEEITIDLVSQKVLFDRAGAKTQEVLKSFDDGKYLQDQEINRTLHEIILDNPDFDDQDLKDILSSAYGESQQKKVEEDLIEAKQSKEKKPEQKQQPASQPEENGYDLDWEDLD
jgi:hypothetical protein